MSASIKLFCENMSPFGGSDPPLYSGGAVQFRWSLEQLFLAGHVPIGGCNPTITSRGGKQQLRWSRKQYFRLRVSPSRRCTPLLSIGGAGMQPGRAPTALGIPRLPRWQPLQRSHETKTSAKTAGRDRQGPHAGRGACGGPQSVPGDGRRGARGGAAGLAGAHPARALKGSGWKIRLPFRSRGRGAA